MNLLEAGWKVEFEGHWPPLGDDGEWPKPARGQFLRPFQGHVTRREEHVVTHVQVVMASSGVVVASLVGSSLLHCLHCMLAPRDSSLRGSFRRHVALLGLKCMINGECHILPIKQLMGGFARGFSHGPINCQHHMWQKG